MKNFLKRCFFGLVLGISLLCFSQSAWAFCGFYVSKADSKLYNQASQVIIARNGQRTILTMANDYQGEAKDFALVVPVPTILKKEQVNIGDRQIIDRLDAFSAPRLVEYFDSNPCQVYPEAVFDGMTRNAAPSMTAGKGARSNEALGVTIEEKFSVGEYDILILSAKESNGLATWLNQNDYQIPQGATPVLEAYIKQGLKFFVAKVNLKEYSRQGFQALRPLMMAYESPKYMLPIRLGMANAKGPQDLLIYLLSPQGTAEVTNYRTVKVPSDVEIPEFIKSEFGSFYKAMFKKSYQKAGRNVIFLEYAWNMANCDPCSAEPLTPEELKKAGVFWLENGGNSRRSMPFNPNGNVFITRLHVRYTPDKFPEDLQFQSTANQNSFQGRYVLRHPYTGEMNCPAARDYRQQVKKRQEQEAKTLANLTSWGIDSIRKRMNLMAEESRPWWRSIWPNP
ncbi:MAG: DUF2330 domain-containing protein [Microcystaceae cyanobacterium]